MDEQLIQTIWSSKASQNLQAKPASKSEAKTIAKNFSAYMAEEAKDKPKEMILVSKENTASALRQANEFIEENGTNNVLILQEEESGKTTETRAHMQDVASVLYQQWQSKK